MEPMEEVSQKGLSESDAGMSQSAFTSLLRAGSSAVAEGLIIKLPCRLIIIHRGWFCSATFNIPPRSLRVNYVYFYLLCTKERIQGLYNYANTLNLIHYYSLLVERRHLRPTRHKEMGKIVKTKS